ncbi:MAG: radical SAM protein [Phycisphaeraceae bacterium]|nr:radical SAM protein [Phycisphaeraceae bacterium]
MARPASQIVHERSFPLDSRVDVPRDIDIRNVDDAYLAVAPLHARWCVIDTEAKVGALRLLSGGAHLTDALSFLARTLGSESAARAELADLLAEIEDKSFYDSAPVRDKSEFNCLKVNITEACNLRCTHCYRWSGDPLEHELPVEDWLRVVDEHVELGGDSLMIGGGEPLARKNRTIPVLSRAKERGLRTVMLTNATLISAQMAKSLVNLLDQLQVSIDGPTQSSNDCIRGEGTFDAIKQALAHFRGTSLFLIIAMTPVPHTIDEFERECGSLLAFLRDWFGDNVILKLGGVLLDGRDVQAIREESARQWSKRVSRLQHELMGAGWQAKLDAASYEPGVRVTGCGFGQSLCVEADGNVLACDIAEDAIVGNVRHSHLREIQRSLRQRSDDVSVDRSPICSSCSLRYLCGGTCRVEAMQRTALHGVTVSINGNAIKGDPLIPHCDEVLKSDLCRRLVALNRFRYERL